MKDREYLESQSRLFKLKVVIGRAEAPCSRRTQASAAGLGNLHFLEEERVQPKQPVVALCCDSFALLEETFHCD